MNQQQHTRAPDNPLSPQERNDYNGLMKKLDDHELTDLNDARRLESYLKKEKKYAQAKNDNDALFGIIILLGILSLTIGLLSSE